MNFDLDDPLAGILSDGSDDSFFDDDILGKKKPEKKNSTPIAAKKNALFDLESTEKTKGNEDKIVDKDVFGSAPKSAIDTKYNSRTVTETEKIKSTSPAMLRSAMSKESNIVQQTDSIVKSAEKLDTGRSPVKTKTKSVDKLDLLDEFGIEPRKEDRIAKNFEAKPLDKGKSSQSLLDDILGGPTGKSNVSNQKRPVTAVKKNDFDFDSMLGKSESKQNMSLNKNIAQKTTARTEVPKESQSKKKPNEDWMGIFQENDEIAEDDDDTNMPSWLVGGDAKKKKKIISESKPEAKTDKVQDNTKPDADKVFDNNKQQNEIHFENIAQITTSHKLDIPISSKLEIAHDDVATEGAALYLQQQESQIMVALQLKAQDERLATMQARQKDSQRVHREAAQAQREQLDSLLQRQAEHRQQMQAIIASHQERITQRIKSLLSTSNDDQQDDVNMDNNIETSAEQRISPYTKEKKQLLQLIQSLQENHDKEIDLMETSYRRQLAFVEVSFNQAEERMKEESDKLVRFYVEKMSWVDEHHQLYKKLSEENLNSLMERHKAENEILQQQHLENIKVLQEHHTALMENVKNAVKQEQVLIKDSAGFSSELNELLVDIKDNKVKCQELVQRIEILSQNTHQNVDKSVQLREAQINDMIQQIKLDRENFEQEKSESRNMIHILETRLKQMTTMIEEEAAALKQKKMEFEFEKATFSKQTEFAKNVLKKQDEEMKMMKDDIQKQYQEKISSVEEEKAKALQDSAIIAKEKASIQSLKLELEKAKAELEAQLEEVTSERSKLNVEKQELHIEEQRVLAKSRDLDLIAKTTMDKQAQAEKKSSEAEFAKHKYEERIRRIQEHVVSLNAREKQIAKEKVALSRERLSMHNERKQLEGRQQCSLCQHSQYNDHGYTLPETYMNPTVSRDYNAIPLHVVEQEMANLMGRSYKSTHSPEVSDYDRGRVDINDFESAHATQPDSGAFRDYLDPKFMMLRLDVQQVISNLDQNKNANVDQKED